MFKTSPLSGIYRNHSVKLTEVSGWQIAEHFGDEELGKIHLQHDCVLVDWSHIGKISLSLGNAAKASEQVFSGASKLETLKTLSNPDTAVLRLTQKDYFILCKPGLNDEMWDNVSYFLKAVIPTAEKANVRLALHPNDPPAPISRGSGQIMSTLDGWKRLCDIVPSPYNGITFDCGVTKELGHDPVKVARYFGERDQINHVHFRNVVTRTPNIDYTEVWIDEGQVDMFAVMKELVRQQYPRLIYPEHPPQNDADNEFPFEGISATTYTGFAYTVGYARGMMQAALATQSSTL